MQVYCWTWPEIKSWRLISRFPPYLCKSHQTPGRQVELKHVASISSSSKNRVSVVARSKYFPWEGTWIWWQEHLQANRNELIISKTLQWSRPGYMSRTLCKTTVRVFLVVRIFTADQQLKLVGCAGIVKVTYAHLREVDIRNDSWDHFQSFIWHWEPGLRWAEWSAQCLGCKRCLTSGILVVANHLSLVKLQYGL